MSSPLPFFSSSEDESSLVVDAAEDDASLCFSWLLWSVVSGMVACGML